MAPVSYDLIAAARRVTEGSLAVVRGETVLIVYDTERKALADALAEATKWLNAKTVELNLDDYGKAPLPELPDAILAALPDAQASVFLARGGAEEVLMRKALVDAAGSHGLRHAHMPGLNAETMAAGLAVDPHRIADTARALRARLRPDSRIELRSPAGSKLRVECNPNFRWVENSGIIRPGRWLNLPAGELLTAPGLVDGVYVADASTGVAVQPALAKAPVSLTVDAGRVTSVSCPDSSIQHAVESHVQGGMNQGRVGLISFGTNIGLIEPSGALLLDQTLPGLHLALGMTLPHLTLADWDSSGQLVLTGTHADLDIDGQAVMRGGRYLM